MEFTDSGSIGQPYREAVKEMTARGVLAGVPEVLPTIPETPADEKPGNDNDNGDILLPEVP